MTIHNHNGSRRDVLVLLDSPGYIGALNSALIGTGTEVSGDDVHRPIGSNNDKEYELPEYCRENMAGRFDMGVATLERRPRQLGISGADPDRCGIASNGQSRLRGR